MVETAQGKQMEIIEMYERQRERLNLLKEIVIEKTQKLFKKLGQRLDCLDEDVTEREVAIESLVKTELFQFDCNSPEVTKVIRWPSFSYFR